MAEKVAEYVEDVEDIDDPRQHMAWALTEWPAFGNQMSMPAVKMLAPFQSELLTGLGFRYHPELATKFKVRDPQTGQAKFVDAEEYAKFVEAGDGDPVEGQARGAVEDMLAHFNVDLAEEFKGLTDEERAAKAAEMAPLAEQSMKALMGIRAQLGVPDDAS